MLRSGEAGERGSGCNRNRFTNQCVSFPQPSRFFGKAGKRGSGGVKGQQTSWVTQILRPYQLFSDGDERFSVADDFTCPCFREIAFVVGAFPQKHGSVEALDQG